MPGKGAQEGGTTSGSGPVGWARRRPAHSASRGPEGRPAPSHAFLRGRVSGLQGAPGSIAPKPSCASCTSSTGALPSLGAGPADQQPLPTPHSGCRALLPGPGAEASQPPGPPWVNPRERFAPGQGHTRVQVGGGAREVAPVPGGPWVGESQTGSWPRCPGLLTDVGDGTSTQTPLRLPCTAAPTSSS